MAARRSNTWRLHPWLPVDIRLPAAAGVLSMGLYLYLEQTGQLDAAQRRLKEASKATEEQVRRASSSFKSLRFPSWSRKGNAAEGGNGTDEVAAPKELSSDQPGVS
jgi:hypothetical protein